MTLWCPRGCGRESRRTILRRPDQPPLCRECFLETGPRGPRLPGPRRPTASEEAEVERLFQRARADLRRRRLLLQEVHRAC